MTPGQDTHAALIDPAELPRRCYFVCATPRTGTNVLCEALWLSSIAGRPTEHFRERERERRENEVESVDELRAILRAGTSPNGVFGTKVMWEHFGAAVAWLQSIAGQTGAPAPQFLASLFPDLRYIRVLRRNKVRQAVSLAKAVQSGSWWKYEPWDLDLTDDQLGELAGRYGQPKELIVAYYRGNRPKPVPSVDPDYAKLRYDFDQIRALHRMIREHEAAWDAYFLSAAVEPLTVHYEDILEDLEAATGAALDFLELPRLAPVSFQVGGMKRQSDAVNDEWTARYTAELAGRAN